MKAYVHKMSSVFINPEIKEFKTIEDLLGFMDAVDNWLIVQPKDNTMNGTKLEHDFVITIFDDYIY